MADRYFILKALVVGFAFFFFRYSFYLTDGPIQRKKYLSLLSIVVVCIGGYFLYLKTS